jgi:endoglucanase
MIRLVLLIAIFVLAGCQPGPATPVVPRATPTLGALFSEPSSTPEIAASQPTAAPTEEIITPIPVDTAVPTRRPVPNDPAFQMNARLGRGINLGNALEAPNEGEWGVVLQEEYFQLIRAKGFQFVRIPINWAAHADMEAPYTIDPDFFARVDWAVENALENDLIAILNIHHYGEIMDDPSGHQERFLALWLQIAERYQDTPETILFELLNEPHGNQMTPSVWNELLVEALAVVRESNPDRFVVVGPVFWNSVDYIDTLQLPEDDRRLIATFHYYSPFEFTHQGAEWASGSGAWLGRAWNATNGERFAVSRDLDKALRWSDRNSRPVLLGEFGAYSKAEMDSRARWTDYVAREAEARGFSWAYWEFCSGFGIYDAGKKQWFEPLLQALLPEEG